MAVVDTMNQECKNHALRQHQRAFESLTEEELLTREGGSTAHSAPTGELSSAPTTRVVEEIFAATHPPCHATSSAMTGAIRAVSKLPELGREFSGESQGGTSAASMASSVGAGPVGLGLGPCLHIGQVSGEDARMSPQ